MVSQIIAFLAGIVMTLINSLGYFGIALAMAIESCNIPLPSEIIMPFTGFLVSNGRFALLPAVLAGAIGGTIGSYVSFALGYYGGETLIRRLIRNYGKYVLVFEYELDEAEAWFKKYGDIVTFTARFLPVIRTFISLPAGMSKMNPKKFTFYAFVGTFIWCLPLAFLGVKLGQNWHSLGAYFHQFDLIIGLGMLAAIGWYIYHKLHKHFAWKTSHKT